MTGTPACFALTSAPVASFGSSDTSKIALAPLVMAFSTSDCCCRSWVNRRVSWVSHRGVAASGTRKYTSPLNADAEVLEPPFPLVPACAAVEVCGLPQAAIPNAMAAAATAHFTFLVISLPLYSFQVYVRSRCELLEAAQEAPRRRVRACARELAWS